jgi:hypothetical protein
MIAGAKGGLREIQFLPRNSLHRSTYVFDDTVALIVARSRKIKTRACSDPEMQQDRRSHDIDGSPELMVQICPFKFCGSDLTFLNQQM